MGVLRLTLAFAVLLAHCGQGFVPLNGMLAVQTFFMISGFYMAMILTEKYRGPGSYRRFLVNRFLRIYPMYWTVALFALLVSVTMYLIIGVGPLEAPQKTGVGGMLLLCMSNLVIFGQDLVMYVGSWPGGPLFFTADYHKTLPQLWTFLLIPPAWSLSVELMFYLIAPLLVHRSTRWIVGLMTQSVLLRVWLFFGAGLTGDPWTGRFFPTEIVFFLAGVLAYRMCPGLGTRRHLRVTLPGAAIGFFAFLFAYSFVPSGAVLGLPIKQAIYYPLAWISIPVLFALCKESKLDRAIGELSYPVYLVHYPMLKLLMMVLHHARLDSMLTPCEIIATLLTSVVLTKCLSEHVEKIRRRNAANRDEPAAARRQKRKSRYNSASGFAVAGTNAPQSP